MKKRIFGMVLALVLVLGLVACGGFLLWAALF